jgi:hypothetical protein
LVQPEEESLARQVEEQWLVGVVEAQTFHTLQK